MTLLFNRSNSDIDAALILGNMKNLSKNAGCGPYTTSACNQAAIPEYVPSLHTHIDSGKLVFNERIPLIKQRRNHNIVQRNTTKENQKIKKFPIVNKKYFRSMIRGLLDRPELSNIISWTLDGRSWKIYSIQVFERLVIPNIFPSMTKFSSFLCLAQAHGFKISRYNFAGVFFLCEGFEREKHDLNFSCQMHFPKKYRSRQMYSIPKCLNRQIHFTRNVQQKPFKNVILNKSSNTSHL